MNRPERVDLSTLLVVRYAYHKLKKAVLVYPPEARLAMLRVLSYEPAARAEAIRRLYGDPLNREMAELLMDLEQDRNIALDVMEVLKESLPGR